MTVQIWKNRTLKSVELYHFLLQKDRTIKILRWHDRLESLRGSVFGPKSRELMINYHKLWADDQLRLIPIRVFLLKFSKNFKLYREILSPFLIFYKLNLEYSQLWKRICINICISLNMWLIQKRSFCDQFEKHRWSNSQFHNNLVNSLWQTSWSITYSDML